MISSVIARLSPTNPESVADMIGLLQSRSGVEVGEVVDGRLLPLTIDALTGDQVEETTRWISQQDGVEFVDVVFVHLEP